MADLNAYFDGPQPPRDHFTSVLEHWSEVQAADTAFHFTDGDVDTASLTYRKLWDESTGLAGYLQSQCGIRSGDRVLLLYPPGLDFVVGLLACHAAGAVPVPAFPPRRNRKASRIRSIVVNADARWALSTTAVVEQLNGDDRVSGGGRHRDLTGVQLLGTDDQSTRDAAAWRRPKLRSDALGVLQYTSGSTGSPKGVMLSHANLIANSELILHGFEPRQRVVGMSWLPTYHDMGLVGGVLMPLFIGRPNVLMSPMTFLQRPARWLRNVSRHKVTISGGPNFAYQLCVDKIDDDELAGIDLSSWEIAFNGAEPIRTSTLRAFVDRFEKFGFNAKSPLPCYGMAETTLIITGGPSALPPVVTSFNGHQLDERMVLPATETPEGQKSARQLVGCGRVLPDERVLIVDPETSKELRPNQIGEIWVQSPSVGRGYWQNREESQRTFHAYTASGDGPFLRTGDLGFIYDGQLYVSGRLKDLILVRGVNRYPQDIEATVERVSDSVQAGSVAALAMTVDTSSSEDDQATADSPERLVIVAETLRSQDVDWDAQLQLIRRAVTEEHDLPPDAVYLVRANSVPKTSSGKIQRHACLHAVRDGKLRVIAQWVRGEAGILAPGGGQSMMQAAAAKSDHVDVDPVLTRAIIAHVAAVASDRTAEMTAQTNIVLDLGLDSLERLEIARNLERTFGGRFPEQVLDEIETIGQVAAAIDRYLSSDSIATATEYLAGKLPQNVKSDVDFADADAESIGRSLSTVAVTPENDVTQFAEYRRLQSMMRQMQLTGVPNPYFTVHDGVVGDTTIVDGRELISFASYNYLGLSGEPRVSQAAADAIHRYGTSVSASRLVSGEKPIHRQLEQAIADWIGVEAAITMVGGHATNETTIGHLVAPGDLILHDALSHNSIVQGALLSGAKRRPFPHNDFDALDRMLSTMRDRYRRVLIIVEGVYSMDGDYCDLPAFIEVKDRHQSMLMVDEAHSFGTMGPTGHGIAEHYGVDAKSVEIWMGTLSKSAASCGGYIAGGRALIELLRYTAPGFVFSVGMPPAQAAAAIAALQILDAEPDRLARLRENSEQFLRLCRAGGLDTGDSGGTPVVPVITGNSITALRLSHRLRADGINVQPILYPAVDESAARLRFFITSDHTPEQIEHTASRVIEHYHALCESLPAATAG